MGYTLKQSDIFDFATMLNAKVKQKSNELYFEYCPYCNGGNHDKETFSINLDNGTYNCFRSSCEAKGHFVELARDFNFPLEFDDDGKKKYRKLTQVKPKPTNNAVEFMAKRGISADVVNKYRLTTQKNNPNILVFPFYDENDILTCVKYRKTDFDKSKDKNKEWFEKNTKPILFGMAQCVSFDIPLIITEGQIDSLTVAECGFDNAVSVPTGAKGFTWLNNVWDWICKFKELIVFGDCEKDKITLVEELSNRLPMKIRCVRREDYLGEKDANDIFLKYGKQAIINCVNNAKTQSLKNIKDLSTVKSIDLDDLPKIKTNIRELDKVIGGFVMGQVALLSGKRGNGKSTFMSQLVCEALEQNHNVFVYSGELADYHFKRWLDFQLAGAENVIVKENKYGDNIYSISDETIEKINNWYKGRAFIYDNNIVADDLDEFESLTKTIENAIKQYDTKFICIDNLMTAMDFVSDQNNLYLAQSNFVGALKKIAIKYDVVIILIAHPRKTNTEFSNDDVSGSSDITNKVDIVMSYQRVDDSTEYNGRLTVTKNRLGGKYAVGENAINLLYSERTKRIYSKSSKQCKYGWDIEYNDFEEIGEDDIF